MMLTALSVQLREQPAGVKRWLGRLRRDRVQIDIKRARGVTLKHVTYISFSGQVRLDKTDKIIGSQRSRLLCSDKLVFPRQSGYQRFDAPDFNARLCANTALAVLRQCGGDVHPGIVDRHGRHTGLTRSALGLCSSVTVITNRGDIYREANEQALDELGAAAFVTTNAADLAKCDLVIVPEPDFEPLCLSPNAVVLAVEPPSRQTPSWFYRYKIKIPNGFDSIKPEDLDGAYFCSALYTLGAQYELGSIVPVRIEADGRTCTVATLCDLLLDNITQK